MLFYSHKRVTTFLKLKFPLDRIVRPDFIFFCTFQRINAVACGDMLWTKLQDVLRAYTLIERCSLKNIFFFIEDQSFSRVQRFKFKLLIKTRIKILINA